MRYLPQEAFVANTDRAWFDFFAERAAARDGRVDEVNFWLPKATTPMRAMVAGELIFFRLKKPDYAIAGYGFFAHFEVLDLDLAWQTFGEKNGDPTRERFFERIGGYRGIDLLHPTARRTPIGCTVLRDAVFWPSERWIPWSKHRNWHPNIVQGRTERDPASISILLAAVRQDLAQPPAELVMEIFNSLARTNALGTSVTNPFARARERFGSGCSRLMVVAQSPVSTPRSFSMVRTSSRISVRVATTYRMACF
jgi:hypothetical protein